MFKLLLIGESTEFNDCSDDIELLLREQSTSSSFEIKKKIKIDDYFLN
jgi:hypothetical protein